MIRKNWNSHEKNLINIKKSIVNKIRREKEDILLKYLYKKLELIRKTQKEEKNNCTHKMVLQKDVKNYSRVFVGDKREEMTVNC